MELNLLKNEDCFVTLASMPNNSIDAIVTDPPYELNFMKKGWDKSGITFNVELWKECYRVLKPGGHLLAFCGTRTYHRMVVAIEDAGFDIKDMVAWIYASGFPKRGNLGKEYDKLVGNKRKVVGTFKSAPDFKDEQFVEQGSMMRTFKKAKRKKLEVTEGYSELEGMSITLKPAIEPIVLAKKEISEENTVKNVIKWGTGALNIDDTRIPLTEGNIVLRKKCNTATSSREYYVNNPHKDWKISQYMQEDFVNDKGRWPANVVIDGSDEVVSYFPIGNGESAARFFYSTKTTTGERNFGLSMSEQQLHKIESNSDELKKKNIHPTVKPIKLMEYLIKLVTPKKGIVYDPFTGSGSTLIAAKINHYNYIGSEMNPEYYKIAQKRIKSAFAGFDFDI